MILTAPLTLKEFSKTFWHLAEPARPFVDNWHINIISDHLEACHRRDIKRLLINIPPRHSKSLLVSVFFPAWEWTRNAQSRFIYASFSSDLSLRDAVKTRQIIQGHEYQQRYGHLYKLTGDQNLKSFYVNDRSGFRKAIGVGTAVTGHGGDYLIFDDPNNPKSTESEVVRNSVNEWATGTFLTRFEDYNTGVAIGIQQRVHEDDLSGSLLAKEVGFELLKIPFRYEGVKYFTTSLNSIDPRTEHGELIDRKRFPELVAKALEKSLGTDANGQLQQNPIPSDTGWFARNIDIVDVLPNDLMFIRYWDKAFTLGGGAYTVGCLMGKSNGDYYVIDIVRGQWDSFLRDEVILQTAQQDREKYARVTTYLEEEPGSAGRDSVKHLIVKLAGFPIFADKVTGDKELRAHGFNSQWGAGNVKILKGDWNTDYLRELKSFPLGKYKDQVDASSGAFNQLSKKGYTGLI